MAVGSRLPSSPALALPSGDALPCLHAGRDDDAGAEELLSRPFIGELATCYTVEDGDTLRRVPREVLRGRGDSLEAWHARALANLAAHVTRTGIRLNGFGSMVAVIFDGDMEATLMLYEPLWTRLHDEMGDRLEVVVPARDVLAVAAGGSAEGRAELRAVVERVFPRDDHPLSACLFGHGDDGWSVLAAPR